MGLTGPGGSVMEGTGGKGKAGPFDFGHRRRNHEIPPGKGEGANQFSVNRGAGSK